MGAQCCDEDIPVAVYSDLARHIFPRAGIQRSKPYVRAIRSNLDRGESMGFEACNVHVPIAIDRHVVSCVWSAPGKKTFRQIFHGTTAAGYQHLTICADYHVAHLVIRPSSPKAICPLQTARSIVLDHDIIEIVRRASPCRMASDIDIAVLINRDRDSLVCCVRPIIVLCDPSLLNGEARRKTEEQRQNN